MSIRIVRLGTSMVALSIASSSIAAGNTPIRTDRDALRAALSGYVTAVSAPAHMDEITINARTTVLGGLTRLAGITTPAALAASPGGIEVPCAVSGSFRARMPYVWPRVVRLDWLECANDPTAPLAKTDGPAEVVLDGNSFSAPTALTLRLGDPSRDLVSDYPVVDSPFTGGSRYRSNVRMTGVIPMDRDPSQSRFLGNYFYEVTGFAELTTLVRDRPNPGPPFYPQVLTYMAEHVIQAGEQTDDTLGHSSTSRLLSGVITFHNYRAPTPTRPVRDQRESYRPRDLRTTYKFEYGDPFRTIFTIDGKAEVYLAETQGFPGCVTPETYQWRTRQALTSQAIISDLFDSGEVVVNNAVVATFYATGVDPQDTQQHVDLSVRGLGTFSFAQPYSILDMMEQAGCAP